MVERNKNARNVRKKAKLERKTYVDWRTDILRKSQIIPSQKIQEEEKNIGNLPNEKNRLHFPF